MTVISREYLKDSAGSYATYVIEIKDFKKKLAETQRGSWITTDVFYVNGTSLSIILFIAGFKTKRFGDRIGVNLVQQPKVKANKIKKVSINKEVIMASISPNSWNYGVPHSRCVKGDLLSSKGTLTMEVTLELLGENSSNQDQLGREVAEAEAANSLAEQRRKAGTINLDLFSGGGNRDGEVQELKEKMDQMSQDMTSLKHKLDNQETELSAVKTKLRKVGSELQGDNSIQQPLTNSAVKCPVCSKVVVRPMRLQQCPRVRLFLLG